ncbi:Ubiquinol-cytochrome c chaperone, CBP3 [Moelleriella libera RCEF 2490]|uniref:Ubiquinol-cytochrome c chaperone, CBP3 n=1 Tax=Moelleriella libera RCEF 2490 TaxID=1081109 RepID=A0A166UWP7_9HYPO|nr:Ubiquinol-cytochrome c chaperone, CBP3 [Moelleriella libera RCEF 2490]
MVCESCSTLTRSLFRAAVRAATSSPQRRPAGRTLNLLHVGMSKSCASSHIVASASWPSSPRWFGSTRPRRLLGMGSSLGESYRVLGASEKLYKLCGMPADYHISEHARKNDEVDKLEDGEEIGKPVDPNNVWHKTFGLKPSFSTWSHVTMLHLYLLNARIRCLERDAYRNWQQQLIDHFFFDCEKKMHLDHSITSSALRQRYLKDIFVQWRGLLLAYDEGLIKGDAVLASAVWRNLFKGSPDVDPRALCAIVGWMRSSLVSLEATSDQDFAQRAGDILAKPVNGFWTRLEEPFKRNMAEQTTATAAAGVTKA